MDICRGFYRCPFHRGASVQKRSDAGIDTRMCNDRANKHAAAEPDDRFVSRQGTRQWMARARGEGPVSQGAKWHRPIPVDSSLKVKGACAAGAALHVRRRHFRGLALSGRWPKQRCTVERRLSGEQRPMV